MNNQIQAVSFHGQTLSVISQQDQLFVAVKPICENIGVQWRAQCKRIQRDEVLSSVASMMDATAADGKTYEYTCLPLEFINGWLFGIDTNRIKNPEVKARVIEYQRECYQALFNYWTKGAYANTKPHSDTIDADQQAMLLEVLNHRAAEELPELQQVVKNIITGQFEQTFGCTLDQLPKDKHAEAIRLILNAPLEGDYLPADEKPKQAAPQAVFKAKRTPSDFDRRHGLLSPEQMFDCGWRVDLLWAVKWLKQHEGQTVKLEPGLTDQLTLELHSILHWYESYRNKLMDIQRIAGMGRLQ